MSFILDALKKSEMERQRQSMPGLVDTGIARPRSRLPAWAIALCVLLAVNLLVLLFVLTRSLMSAPPSPSAPAATPTRRTETAAGAETGPGVAGADAPGAATPAATTGQFSPLDAPPVYAPEIPVGAAPVPQPAGPKAASPGSSGLHAVHRRDPLLVDEDYKANDDEVLPTINEISLTGAQALPELHLDVHVFATQPAERFVYVNMRKYHEGAKLQEGPTIERIRRDGVILNYQGLRFLLPRQ
ncbi:MAG TPA: general secretion pathway protein GspB [Steroidobacteraceae bacterium]|nr:general secretion pathway protein GspB [Steroidobacteraceae bacterium]